jgi:hypothetical protein
MESKIRQTEWDDALPSHLKIMAETAAFLEAEMFFAIANTAGQELLKAVKVPKMIL